MFNMSNNLCGVTLAFASLRIHFQLPCVLRLLKMDNLSVVTVMIIEFYPCVIDREKN